MSATLRADALASLAAIREDLARGRLDLEALPARLRAFADGVEQELGTPTLATAAEPGIGGAPLAR